MSFFSANRLFAQPCTFVMGEEAIGGRRHGEWRMVGVVYGVW